MKTTTIYPGCKYLTCDEAEELDKLDEKAGWGFYMSEVLSMIADHIKAWEQGKEGVLTKEKIEYRLTDCNYHTLCKFLHGAEYKEALEWVIEEY